MTKTTYKVGDKVRILKAKKIQFGERYWNDGDISEIKRLLDDGRPCLSRNTKELDDRGLPLWSTELQYIEKVEESDAKMTQFKIGDKVRIVNADAISSPMAEINNGDIFEITGDDGGIKNMFQSYRVSDSAYLGINPGDIQHIELVSQKPTKNQRITALEQKVEAMQAEIDALKAAQKPKSILSGEGTLIFDGKPIAKVSGISYKTMTPNGQRKAIIDEAKAFVEVTLAEVDEQMGWQTTKIRTYKEHGRLRIEFIVNTEKRTVVALAGYGNITELPDVLAKGIAKCNPSDVFNEHIGKAIALGRALGLDVSKFEKAVQPSEVVVGMVVNRVNIYGDDLGPSKVKKVSKLDKGDYKTYETNTHIINESLGYGAEHGDKITDDTEAKY